MPTRRGRTRSSSFSRSRTLSSSSSRASAILAFLSSCFLRRKSISLSVAFAVGRIPTAMTKRLRNLRPPLPPPYYFCSRSPPHSPPPPPPPSPPPPPPPP